jgi:putative ABC transport system ATP-binding protein
MNEEERTFLRLSELGYVFQDYAILPSLTSLENVMLPLLMLGVETKHAKTKAEYALDKVGLADKLKNYPSQLSGGQQQRVAIARAIAHEPKIIFADEPTANLDSETSEMVLEAFIKLHKDGQTIMMVTHEKDYAALTDRVIELSDGKIINDFRVKNT